MYEGHLIRERKAEHTRAILTALAVQAGSPPQSKEGVSAQQKAWKLLQDGLEGPKPAGKRARKLTQGQYAALARATGKTPEWCKEEVEERGWDPPLALIG